MSGLKRRPALRSLMAAALVLGLAAGSAWAAEKAAQDSQKAAKAARCACSVAVGKLSLSDEQRDQIKKARQEHAGALKEGATAVREARRALQEALENDAGDADLQAAVDKLAAARKKLADASAALRSDVEKVLTVRQRAMLAMKPGWGLSGLLTPAHPPDQLKFWRSAPGWMQLRRPGWMGYAPMHPMKHLMMRRLPHPKMGWYGRSPVEKGTEKAVPSQQPEAAPPDGS